MTDRYHLDRRTHRYRRARRRMIVTTVFVFFIALFYFLSNLQITPEQNITNDQTIVKPYDAAMAKLVPIDKPLFKLELPEGWTETKPDASMVPAPQYVFASSPKDQQVLRLYVDNVPSAMGINKALTVSARSDTLDHDSVSENCVNYTELSKKDVRTGLAPAKWQNIDFLCDVGNSQRPLVGAVSADGMNYVKLTGPTVGEHKLFIVYGDYSINPNYTTFYDILNTLHMK
jgi:hypothetical protein